MPAEATIRVIRTVGNRRLHVGVPPVRFNTRVECPARSELSIECQPLSDKEFDALFTTDKPIIFAYHGYPWLIHRLTYRRTNHKNLRVRGCKEEGATSTPFDMVVVNDLDRFHLFDDVIVRVPQLSLTAAHVKQAIRDKLIEHRQYIAKHGEDMPEMRSWKWGATR